MEHNHSKIANQEKNLAFEELQGKIEAYLSGPKSGDPHSDVNNYFGGISDPEEVVRKTMSPLFDTRHRLFKPQSSDFDPVYGNAETIVMHLPYFYPLHLTLFSWYVGASLETAQKLSDEDKGKLARKISEDAVIYCLMPDEVGRVKERLGSLSSSNKAPILPPARLSRPWYKNLNPFK